MPSYLIAPSANFVGDILTSLVNARVGSDTNTGLSNGVEYRAIRLDTVSPIFIPAILLSAPVITGGEINLGDVDLYLTAPTVTGNPAPVVTFVVEKNGVDITNTVVDVDIPYTGNATYSVTWTATNSEGSDTTTKQIVVNKLIPPELSGGGLTEVADGLTFVTPTATGNPEPVVTFVAMRDGVDITDTVIEQYIPITLDGTYSITFTAANGAGADATVTFTAEVSRAVAPSITGGQLIVEGNGIRIVAPAATGFPEPVLTYVVELSGTDITDTVDNGVIPITVNGTYSIIWTAENPTGTDTLTLDMEIDRAIAPVLTGGTFVENGDFITITNPTVTGNPTPTLSVVVTKDNVDITDTIIEESVPITGNGLYKIVWTATNAADSVSKEAGITIARPVDPEVPEEQFTATENGFTFNKYDEVEYTMTPTENGFEMKERTGV